MEAFITEHLNEDFFHLVKMFPLSFPPPSLKPLLRPIPSSPGGCKEEEAPHETMGIVDEEAEEARRGQGTKRDYERRVTGGKIEEEEESITKHGRHEKKNVSEKTDATPPPPPPGTPTREEKEGTLYLQVLWVEDVSQRRVDHFRYLVQKGAASRPGGGSSTTASQDPDHEEEDEEGGSGNGGGGGVDVVDSTLQACEALQCDDPSSAAAMRWRGGRDRKGYAAKHRCLKLLLTDGYDCIWGVERNGWIGGGGGGVASLPPVPPPPLFPMGVALGSKICVRVPSSSTAGPQQGRSASFSTLPTSTTSSRDGGGGVEGEEEVQVPVLQHGVLRLSGTNTRVLGGSVPSLQWHWEAIARAYLRERSGRPNIVFDGSSPLDASSSSSLPPPPPPSLSSTPHLSGGEGEERLSVEPSRAPERPQWEVPPPLLPPPTGPFPLPSLPSLSSSTSSSTPTTTDRRRGGGKEKRGHPSQHGKPLPLVSLTSWMITVLEYSTKKADAASPSSSFGPGSSSSLLSSPPPPLVFRTTALISDVRSDLYFIQVEQTKKTPHRGGKRGREEEEGRRRRRPGEAVTVPSCSTTLGYALHVVLTDPHPIVIPSSTVLHSFASSLAREGEQTTPSHPSTTTRVGGSDHGKSVEREEEEDGECSGRSSGCSMAGASTWRDEEEEEGLLSGSGEQRRRTTITTTTSRDRRTGSVARPGGEEGGHWDLRACSVEAQLRDGFLRRILGLPAPIFEALCKFRQAIQIFLDREGAVWDVGSEESTAAGEEGRGRERSGAISSEVLGQVEQLMTTQATLLSVNREREETEEEWEAASFDVVEVDDDEVDLDGGSTRQRMESAMLETVLLPLPSSPSPIAVERRGREVSSSRGLLTTTAADQNGGGDSTRIRERETEMVLPFSEATRSVWRLHYQHQASCIDEWIQAAQQRVGSALEGFGEGEFILEYPVKPEQKHVSRDLLEEEEIGNKREGGGHCSSSTSRRRGRSTTRGNTQEEESLDVERARRRDVRIFPGGLLRVLQASPLPSSGG